MSPEQARGEVVDARTDLFSLGTVLYTLLAGHSPFRAETAMGVLRRVCEDTPRPLTEANPNVPAWLDAFVAKLHAKRPADRFESASQVSDLLTRCLAHVQQPSAVPLPNEVASLVQRPVTQDGFWSKAVSRKATLIAGTFATASVLVIALVQNGLISSNRIQLNEVGDDTTQHPPTSALNPVPLENHWLDNHDADAGDLDQRTKRLEQEDEW